MDPNATLKAIAFELSKGIDCDEYVDELVEALLDWLERGGFQPDWNAEPLAASYCGAYLRSKPRNRSYSFFDKASKRWIKERCR